MNQPTGEAIKMVYLPRSKTADLNKNSTDMQRVPIIKSYVRECDLESINSKFTNEEPNNYTVEYIKKQFLTIGQERQLNALYLSKESQSNIKVIAIEPNSISSLGIGDEKGENGNVGLAHCFLDTEVDNKELRLYRLWEQAKCFALDNHGNAHWFTPNLGFCNNDELVFLSLESKNGWINYPEIAIVIRIILEKEAFYIIDFSMEKYDISLRGVAYKPDYTEDFISFNNTKKSKLFEIICEIVTEEHLSKEYIYKQKNKIATFNHSGADSSNWIYNGIKKITDRKLNKPKNLYK